MPKEGSPCVLQSEMFIYSVLKMSKNYYPQVFSEECRYVVKKKKRTRFIDNNCDCFFECL